jgi:hypothetical protein
MDHTKLRELAEHAESVRKANADLPTRRLAMEQSDAEQEWFAEVPPSVVLALLDELDALRAMLPTAEEREALEGCASYALYSGSIRERSASCAAFAFLTRPEPATGAAVPTMEELDRLAADRLKAMQSLNDLGESERSACDAAHDAHKAACRRAGKDSAQQYADWFHNRRARTASGAEQTPADNVLSDVEWVKCECADAECTRRIPVRRSQLQTPGTSTPRPSSAGIIVGDQPDRVPPSGGDIGGPSGDATKAAEAMREACAEICEDRRAYLRGLDSRYHAKATADLAEMAREIRALPLPKTTRNTGHTEGGDE